MMEFVMAFFLLVEGWFLFSWEIWETNESKLLKFHSGIPPDQYLVAAFFNQDNLLLKLDSAVLALFYKTIWHSHLLDFCSSSLKLGTRLNVTQGDQGTRRVHELAIIL